jgi:hypothetical protein
VRWKPFHLALLLFQFVWLNVVLPGHTRGIVTLPGATGCEMADMPRVAVAVAVAAHACCSTPKPVKSATDPHSVPAKRAAQCAICAHALRITPPPVVDLAPPRAGLLELLPPPAARSARSSDFFATYLGRAPPPAC